jgi:hypothetical protein
VLIDDDNSTHDAETMKAGNRALARDRRVLDRRVLPRAARRGPHARRGRAGRLPGAHARRRGPGRARLEPLPPDPLLGVPGWITYARIVRGETLSLRERDFVTAERVVGAAPVRILFRHVLPNATAPIIVIASLRVGGAVLVETGLSFLGLGVQPPTPSWGSMVNEGARFLEIAPWIAMGSGGAIFLTVLGANFVGDAIRDVLDPRLRGQ